MLVALTPWIQVPASIAGLALFLAVCYLLAGDSYDHPMKHDSGGDGGG